MSTFNIRTLQRSKEFFNCFLVLVCHQKWIICTPNRAEHGIFYFNKINSFETDCLDDGALKRISKYKWDWLGLNFFLLGIICKIEATKQPFWPEVTMIRMKENLHSAQCNLRLWQRISQFDGSLQYSSEMLVPLTFGSQLADQSVKGC